MFISVFNYLCLKDCHPPELQWCWNGSRLVKLLVFCLLGWKFGQSLFVGVSFISFYKQAKSVSQQMRNCVCKTQTATTGTRPPLVASQCSFAGLIRRSPPPTFSDTAITDRHSDTTIFQLRAHWVRISWSFGSEKSFGHVSPVYLENNNNKKSIKFQGDFI